MSEKVMIAVDNRGIRPSVTAWLIDRGRSPGIGLEIEIITVAELGWMPVGSAEVGYRTAYEHAQWEAENAVRSALPGVPVVSTMEWGMPAERLVEASKHADLLVLGSDKTGVIAGFVSGTTPLRVVSRSACPTIVVPSGWQPRARRVVVGVALDPLDDGVLEFAASESLRLHSELRIVHALPMPPALLSADLIAPVTQDAVRDLAQRKLTDKVEELAGRYPDLAITAVIPHGEAARALAEEGKDARLVVVGTHGRGVVRRFVLGSVSHDLLLNTSCPVAVVRNAETGR